MNQLANLLLLLELTVDPCESLLRLACRVDAINSSVVLSYNIVVQPALVMAAILTIQWVKVCWLGREY